MIENEQTVALIDTSAEQQSDQLRAEFIFPSLLYTIEKPEFLPAVRKVAKKFVDKIKKQVDLDPIYPVYQTEPINYEPEMQDFSNYVAQAAWIVLKEQGYAMENFETFFESMWVQEHHKHSAMEQHVHGYGVQMVGFYFLDVPKGSPHVVFHDPKPAKVQLNLPEASIDNATIASNMIHFEPKPGTLMLTNAWLAHSFTRSAATEPMRFVHFNVAVRHAAQICPTANEQNLAEVI